MINGTTSPARGREARPGKGSLVSMSMVMNRYLSSPWSKREPMRAKCNAPSVANAPITLRNSNARIGSAAREGTNQSASRTRAITEKSGAMPRDLGTIEGGHQDGTEWLATVEREELETMINETLR